MSERLLNVRETAAYLGMTQKYVYKHAREMGGVKLGSVLRFRRAEIERYLAERRLDGRRSP